MECILVGREEGGVDWLATPIPQLRHQHEE